MNDQAGAASGGQGQEGAAEGPDGGEEGPRFIVATPVRNCGGWIRFEPCWRPFCALFCFLFAPCLRQV